MLYKKFYLRKYQTEIEGLEKLHQIDELIMETQKDIEKDLHLKNEEQMIVIAAVFFYYTVA